MALLKILQYPDRRLRIVAKPVTEFNAHLQRLAEDMLATMYHAGGIGLAATQVNTHKRVVVIDVSEARDQPKVLINPRVQVLDNEVSTCEEGCLSVPSLRSAVQRPTHIRLHWQDAGGGVHEAVPQGLEAVCVQHEIDHLEGKVFVDYLSPALIRKYRRELAKGAITAEPAARATASH